MKFEGSFDIIESVAKEVFKDKVIEVPENVILELEGPNIIFKRRVIQFRISTMKFLPDSNHKERENFLGYSAVIFEILYRVYSKKEDYETEIRENMIHCLKVVESLFKNNVFQEEGSSALVKVEL